MQAESLKVLEGAEITPAQTRAIVRAIEIELARPKDTLATNIREDLAGLRTSMAEWRAELRGEIHAAVGSATRQMYMALLVQTWVLLGYACFFATYAR